MMYPDDRRSTKMVTFSSMGKEMEEVAAEIAVRAVMQYSLEEDVAEHVKQVNIYLNVLGCCNSLYYSYISP